MGAVEQVEDLPLGALADDVDDGELLGHAVAHELEEGRGAHAAGAADNGDLH